MDAGDVNGDDFDDLIIGGTYVVFGKASGFAANIDLSTLNGATGFKLNGSGSTYSLTGNSVASAGDVNGDGFDDLIVSTFNFYSYSYGTPPGGSYIVFGKASTFDASIDLLGLNGSTGFKLSGVPTLGSSNISVASAGDLNGDGCDDLIVGAAWDSGSSYKSGASYVVFGKTSGFAADIDVSTLNGGTGFRLVGAAAYDYAGWSVASAAIAIFAPAGAGAMMPRSSIPTGPTNRASLDTGTPGRATSARSTATARLPNATGSAPRNSISASLSRRNGPRT